MDRYARRTIKSFVLAIPTKMISLVHAPLSGGTKRMIADPF